MKNLFAGIAAVCLGGLTPVQSSNLPAKPGPELQRLADRNGEWTYQTVRQTTPLGPGYKVTGKMTRRVVLNGFACECLYEEKGPTRETHGFELMWYDPATSKYAYVYLGDDGSIEQGPFAMTTNGTTWEASCVAGGTVFRMRRAETFSPDGLTSNRIAEISFDGRSWIPYLESTLTKTQAAPGPTARSRARPVLLVAREQSSLLDFMLTKEVWVMINLLEKAGYRTVVASLTGQPLVGKATTLRPDIKLADVNVDDYAGFLLPCMAPPLAGQFPAPRELALFARRAVGTGKPVAAQMSAVGTLADAGVLKGRQFAMNANSDRLSYFADAVWKGDGVVQDGNIITSGVCPNMANEMGKPDGTAALTQKFITALGRLQTVSEP